VEPKQAFHADPSEFRQAQRKSCSLTRLLGLYKEGWTSLQGGAMLEKGLNVMKTESFLAA